MTRRNVWLGIALSLAIPVAVLASNLVTPNTFTPGTTISSAQVNANFAAVETAVNKRGDVYGDGSAGTVVLTTNTNWRMFPPSQMNFQFTNLSIGPGVTLTVPSGLVIQVTDTFHNAGTIIVEPYVGGGEVHLSSSAPAEPSYVSAGVGVARSGAASGNRVVVSNVAVAGGLGGNSIGSLPTIAAILRPGPAGGGGGAGALVGSDGYGSSGGGTLVVLVGGALNNAGTIQANGETNGVAGAGGGGGGIIVLASRTTIVDSGPIMAAGGDGSPNGTNVAAGGGGGGGIVQLIAPTITRTAVLSAPQGAAGSSALPFSPTASRQGGGGGGACAGDGGRGGGISAAGALTNANAGAGGSVRERTIDPTSLF